MVGVDAYGNITYIENPDFKQPYGFTGREFDEESGLYYYRARYYDPLVGIFLQVDPIGFSGGDFNLYRYVQSDPVNWIDPYGLYTWGELTDKFAEKEALIPPADDLSNYEPKAEKFSGPLDYGWRGREDKQRIQNRYNQCYMKCMAGVSFPGTTPKSIAGCFSGPISGYQFLDYGFTKTDCNMTCKSISKNY